MCTAATFMTKDHYFGRNLDLEYSYKETVTITPRNYPFVFRLAGEMKRHYAMIGMAYVAGDYPLYYEATNEKGLSIAGLNFPGNAHYCAPVEGKDNICQFELIPWILGQCENLDEVRKLLDRINLVAINFSDSLPLSPLHWIIADRNGAITLEAVKDGIKVYDNPVGVLTNNPSFDYHMTRLSEFMQISPSAPLNRLADALEIVPYSRGMGAMGLPGDLSSASRFVRAVFTKMNSVCGESEAESVGQFFHIMESVAMRRGTVRLGDQQQITVYSCCCNTDRGIYYYTTYGNRQITGVDMHRENLDGDRPISYPLRKEQNILMEN